MDGIEKLRTEIGNRYEALSNERNIVVNDKLLFYLMEPPGEQHSLTIVYRGNYKMYFNDRINDEQCEVLFEVLLEFADLVTHVDLSYNHLTAASMPTLGAFIESATSLESLNLQHNEIGETGSQIVFEALERLSNDEEDGSSLVYLNLEGNQMKSEGLLGITPEEKLFEGKSSKIEGFLKNNSKLLELNLNDNQIDEIGIIELISQLNTTTNANVVSSLSIDNTSYTNLSQITCFHIGRMLKTNENLISLSLRKNMINDEGMKTICENLIFNRKLRILDVGANKITYVSCIELANYLKDVECTLESLIMNNNRTGYFGARAISSAITENKSLVHLDMTTNDISDDGLSLIANALRKNEILVSVKLFWNHFGEKSTLDFHKLINEKNPNRSSDWFLDFETNLVDEKPQIAYLESSLPYDIYPTKRYYLNDGSNPIN